MRRSGTGVGSVQGPVREPLQQRGAVGLGLLAGLPPGLLHLPLVPALHLHRHRLEEVLRHLLGVRVVPLLSKRGSAGPVPKDLQSPDPRRPPGLGPALLLVAPPSVPPPLPGPGGGFGSAAAAALCGRRQAAGPVVPAPPRPAVVQVHVRQVPVLPLGVSADTGTLLGPNHLDRRRGDPGGRRSADVIIMSLIAV
ncbi:hypothetical protein EYF80_050222 [Liparis tanakae]|uniref:Uncharacterized protein n=1 Tax=Liparis tanakae TaxID=230148 RepID=A0A4Z2FFT2_9TELE|nr:hypothetical protein EYF80_050222 [Liparis tanakae]